LAVDRLRSNLRKHSRIALDTSVFIYQIENNPRYVAATDQIFSYIQQAGHQAVTSAITLTELLVHPYRSRDLQRADEFYAVLATFPNLEWVAVDLHIADTAAQVRGLHGLKTPDALQAATALQRQATAFITNDPAFSRIAGFETLVLDDLL